MDALHQAAVRQPRLGVVASAWSAPAWMKASGQLEGGGLAAGKEQAYADLLTAQADALLDDGLPLVAMTLGNEPGHSNTSYPTMTMTDGQLTTLAQAVDGPLGDQGVGLWALDHNWADRPRLDTLLAAAPGSYSAAAFHCYGGDPAAMGGLAVPSVLTECTGGDWDPDWGSTFRWQAQNLVVTPVASGSTGLILWNLALDPDHGPHTGGCGNCRGIVTVDPATGAWEPGPSTTCSRTSAAPPTPARPGSASWARRRSPPWRSRTRTARSASSATTPPGHRRRSASGSPTRGRRRRGVPHGRAARRALSLRGSPPPPAA